MVKAKYTGYRDEDVPLYAIDFNYVFKVRDSIAMFPKMLLTLYWLVAIRIQYRV